MKILVEGKLDNLKQTKFECPRCGCVFIANEMEYRAEAEFYGYYTVMCECPCCKIEVLMDHQLGYSL